MTRHRVAGAAPGVAPSDCKNYYVIVCVHYYYVIVSVIFMSRGGRVGAIFKSRVSRSAPAWSAREVYVVEVT